MRNQETEEEKTLSREAVVHKMPEMTCALLRLALSLLTRSNLLDCSSL